MNVALRRTTMSVEEFLAWEERQPRKYEFDGFQPVGMVGVTDAHAAVQANLLTALNSRLKGKPCRARGSDLRIQVVGRVRYPDALVYCKPVAANTTVITEPVVLFEILSPSSLNTDLNIKNAEYRATPSVQRYVVLQQSSAGATVFWRKGEDWVADIVMGEGAMLVMPEIGIEVPLAELYEGVELEEAEPEP